MKQLLKSLLAFFLILLSFSARPGVSETNKSDFLFPVRKSDTRFINQPNGPFAVMLFNEDALGVHIGVIYYDRMGVPADGSWWLSERFWTDRLWSSDVTSILWGPTAKYLYVSTSRIYGNGSVFRLDLLNRTAEKIYPTGDVNRTNILQTEISGFNDKTNQISIRVIFDDNTNEDLVRIPVN